MSNPEAMPGSDRSRSDHDLVTGLCAAMRDAWLGASGQSTANWRRFADAAGKAAAHSPPGGQQHLVAADFVLPMGHAMMIATSRSLSFWLNLAQIVGTYQAKSIHAVSAEGIGSSAGLERLVAADELRGLLREVGDLATREARLLQSEFGILAESIAQSLQPSGQSGSYHRRWREKI